MSSTLSPALLKWARSHVDFDPSQVQALRNEASTRKFWRCGDVANSFILMDSPPATENNEQFVILSDIFRSYEVPVPQVQFYDLDQGYLIAEDVGDHDFFQSYAEGNVEACLDLAYQILLNIQTVTDSRIPLYDADRLNMELGIFREFICERWLKISPNPLAEVAFALVQHIDDLPRVTVHRDFHCRNLTRRADAPYIGVVDFQDALVGPYTYDLASLLYDCYWDHDEEEINRRIHQFWIDYNERGIACSRTLENLRTDLCLTALQRLVKAAGIFIRLWQTKNQRSHLPSVIPTLRKARKICSYEPAVNDLGNWLDRQVIPLAQEQLRSRS